MLKTISLQRNYDESDEVQQEAQGSVGPKDSRTAVHPSYVELQSTSGHVELQSTSVFNATDQTFESILEGSFRESKNSRPSIIYRFQESFLDVFPDLIQKLEETTPDQRGWLLLRQDSEYGYFRSGTRGEIVVSVGTYQCFLVLKAKILGGGPTTSFSEIRNWVEEGILAVCSDSCYSVYVSPCAAGPGLEWFEHECISEGVGWVPSRKCIMGLTLKPSHSPFAPSIKCFWVQVPTNIGLIKGVQIEWNSE